MTVDERDVACVACGLVIVVDQAEVDAGTVWEHCGQLMTVAADPSGMPADWEIGD